MNPLTYRPGPVDPDDGETDEWADNWLSNALAWASRTFLPKWCESPEHWTVGFTQHLFTSCPCCLLFRGVIVGAACIIALEVVAFLIYIAIVTL